tara:strand:- start:577 stop:1080 length:504 start_codon:yes stop_codon:yes gene_type:complete
MTPQERKQKVAVLREQHEDYFQTTGEINAAYIPKMAYRPSGKDELHVSFFPSELEKNKDIYTEFASIEYESEDPKRTLYLHKYNPHWRDEYEIIESSSGFQRHIIPVSELKIVNDLTKNPTKTTIFELDNVEELDDPDNKPMPGLVEALVDINKTLKAIQIVLKNQK